MNMVQLLHCLQVHLTQRMLGCSDYIFLGWSGDINSNDNIIEFEITSNINVTANFKDTVKF